VKNIGATNDMEFGYSGKAIDRLTWWIQVIHHYSIHSHGVSP